MSVNRHQQDLSDWDIITVADLTKAAQSAANQTQNIANSLFNRVEKIASKMTRAFPNSKSAYAVSRDMPSANCPLNEKQYHLYMDSEGRVKCLQELRLSAYRRGIDVNLRKAIWKQLLNVYPPGLTGLQRIEYMKSKSELYYQFRYLWQTHQNDPQVELIYNMVKKDVLRTDRSHSFYSGLGEENKNVNSLLNILTTFALNHKVRYCQGMSDLASPILYAMRDESHAYICFCALMTRLSDNFSSDGVAMSGKFQHLIQLLMYYDPEFYCYLKQNNAHELLFCYRWILLELKREFAFDDALFMLEVLWSSIPPSFITDLPLFDEAYRFVPGSSTKSDSTDSTLSISSPMDSLSLNGTSIASNVLSSSFDRDTLTETFVGSNGTPSYNGRPNHRRNLSSKNSSTNGSNGHIHDLGTYSSLKQRNEDELLNSSSGRGSLSAYSSVGASSASLKSNVSEAKPTRPLRTIRFLPKILSNDSREIDSPDEDDFNNTQYSFPPKFIDKQFSIDDDENGRRMGSFDEDTRRMGSFDRDDRRRVRSFEAGDVPDGCINRKGSFGPLSPKRGRPQGKFHEMRNDGRAKLLRQRNTHEEELLGKFDQGIEADFADDLMVHCNGEYQDGRRSAAMEWNVPRGLARSISCDSLKSNNINGGAHNDREYNGQNHGYENEGFCSRSDSDNHCSYRLNGNRSNSSSCSSLVILSSTGSTIDSICSSKLRVPLPSPKELGSNNAFMLFLCLTLLLQHRETVMSRRMDSNEIAMYFDSLVRKHNVRHVLETSRHLFHSYLSQWQCSSLDDDEANNCYANYMP